MLCICQINPDFFKVTKVMLLKTADGCHDMHDAGVIDPMMMCHAICVDSCHGIFNGKGEWIAIFLYYTMSNDSIY